MNLHDLDIPVDTSPTVAVVAHSANHATDGRAMATRTDGVASAGRIPTVVIVHEPIAIVVHPIAGRFPVVGPVVGQQVHVVVVGAATLQHSHHNAVAVGRGPSCGDVPRKFGVDVVVGTVNVVPLRTKLRVVGRRPIFHVMVELGRHHRGQFVQRTDNLLPIKGHILIAEQEDGRELAQGLAQLHAHWHPLNEDAIDGQVLGLDVGVEFDNQFTGHRCAGRWVLDQSLGSKGGAHQAQPCHGEEHTWKHHSGNWQKTFNNRLLRNRNACA